MNPTNSTKPKPIKKLLKGIRANGTFIFMLLPGLFVLLINNYIPMFGVVIDFKRYRFNGYFFMSIITSEWIGFKNFEFFPIFSTYIFVFFWLFGLFYFLNYRKTVKELQQKINLKL